MLRTTVFDSLNQGQASCSSTRPRSTLYKPLHSFKFHAGGRRALGVSRSASLERQTTVVTEATFINWLKENGVEDTKLQLVERDLDGRPIHTVVAAQQLQPGDVVLRVPLDVVVTLDRVFEDAAVAELLTDNKLSELACLTLYLMYEKKRGKSSFWYEYIKELDRQRGRGQMGAKTPLLWEEHELDRYLAGSPMLQQVQQRLKAIEREYNELDTVWFMAGSLFGNYPYDIPTEAFSLELFTQAFAAVQASVVHLQGVPLSRRFALVPLGPPLLRYSSTCKAMLSYDASGGCIQLAVDRSYHAGEPVYAWCGPQPNSRLLMNYGIVDEANPYDKLALTATLPNTDPLFHLKRGILAEQQLVTMQTFDLQRNQVLPPALLPYMRLALCSDADTAKKVGFGADAAPLSQENESAVISQLLSYLHCRLQRYPTSIEEDIVVIESPNSQPRQKVAARLTKIEKQILTGAKQQLLAIAQAQGIQVADGDCNQAFMVKLT